MDSDYAIANRQETLSAIVQQVLKLMSNVPPPDIITVFSLTQESIDEITVSIRKNLPENFSTTIEINPISSSEHKLKSLHSRGTKTVEIVYDPNVFRYITPEQFLRTHFHWLIKEVTRLYEKEPELQASFSIEDAFQECCLYLDRILSKYTEQCNLRTFVANRLRRYFERIVERQLEARLKELETLVYTKDRGR